VKLMVEEEEKKTILPLLTERDKMFKLFKTASNY